MITATILRLILAHALLLSAATGVFAQGSGGPFIFGAGGGGGGGTPGGASGNLQTNDGAGGFGAYGGADCTNQFIRDLSASGAPTCGSVGTADITDANVTPAKQASAVNAQTGTSYTVLDSDRGKLVTHTNASAIAVTLPQAGAGSAFIAGWFADFQNRGAGTVTITPTTSTIDGAASLTLITNQGVRIYSDGTNYFSQRGRGIPASGTDNTIGTGACVAAPATPSAGVTFYCDSTNDEVGTVKSPDGGIVSNTVVPDTGASNNFLTGISAKGVITKAQPAFSNISGTATTAQLPAVSLRRLCTIIVGTDNGSALVNADLGPQNHLCFIPAGGTVQEISVRADAGTPNVIVRRTAVDGTTHTALLSSALATSASGAVACAKTTATTSLDGSTSCTNTLQNTALTVGHTIGLASGTAGGTAKRMSIFVYWTVD